MRGERRQITWAEFDRQADDVARALSARGFIAGHRVAIVMSNRIELAVSYFGILRGGMVAVPVNPRATAREIGRMLTDSGARIALCDDIGVDDVRAAAKESSVDLSVAVVGARVRSGELSYADFLAKVDGIEPASPADPEALAVLLYTSGTSGKPRGAMLPHRALRANIEQIAALDPAPMTSDDTVLALLPLFHIYGLNAVLGQAVYQGARTVLVDGFDPDSLLDLIEEFEITNLPIAPPVVAAWAGREDLRAKFASVRHVLSGASPLDPDLADAFEESAGVAIEQGYGLTETAPVLATTFGWSRNEGEVPKRGSIGRPLPGIELRIVEASGTGATPGDPAEIWARGDNVFTGYWPDGNDGPDDDGWYRTGDVGFLDEEGDLTIVDRLKELVIVSGFNVYPSEVEEIIATTQGVSDVAVVGTPDEETGEAVLAFVVPKDDIAAREHALMSAVRETCEDKLARFKWPKDIVIVEGLPYSVTGKIAKGRLRSLARSRALGLD